MTWRGILSAVLAAVAAIALIVFMRPISEWVANLFIDNPTEVATVVGHLEQVDGKVEKRDNQNAAWIAAKGGDPIKQSERVRVGAGNHLILRLNSQHSL